jgi:GT2 family glycosyltransferase
MISVICVSNDVEILAECLSDSLATQNTEFEFIEVNNLDGKYKSAASGLNKGAEGAKGKYLMFVHQDVHMLSSSTLEDIERMLDALPDVGIAGVAGRRDHMGVITNITHGEPPKHAGHMRLERPEKVQTVDECLFVVPRSIFDTLKFDEQTCFDWHLYAVDYSLSVKKLGKEVYVLPVDIHHESGGASMSKMYHRTLEGIRHKHRRDYPWIHTSLGSWRTNYPVWLQLFSIRTKRRLRRISGEQSKGSGGV